MHPLGNVIWQALTGRQSHLAAGRGTARKFLSDVSMLAALAKPDAASWACLVSLLSWGERVGLFLDEAPDDVAGLRIVVSVPLLQMVHDGAEVAANEDHPISFASLSESDVPDMLALTKLTNPGPFGLRTREMGQYLGVRHNGNLVAMAGERLRIPGYTEISAVCTHPDYLGRGYATTLIRELMTQIRKRNEIAFLHVRPQNQRAVALYQRLGFRTGIERHYTIVERK